MVQEGPPWGGLEVGSVGAVGHAGVAGDRPAEAPTADFRPERLDQRLGTGGGAGPGPSQAAVDADVEGPPGHDWSVPRVKKKVAPSPGVDAIQMRPL